ncbi:MAG: MBOAT family protein [Planctomycetes bacterium]|nr:MBOAT family protein [Planctomycetota bacterium]
MSFTSIAFLLFCPVTLGLWHLLPWFPAAKGALLVASLFFYGYWKPPYLLLLVLTTGVDYLASRRIHAAGAGAGAERTRRAWLVASIGSNLLSLGFFKYAGFVVDNVNTLAAAVGLGLECPRPEIVLPLGISFYTFQSMSYTIDVFRRRIRPARSFAECLLFVSFFPQLVAGPILRAHEFLYQLGRRRRVSLPIVWTGLYYVVQGYFLKVVLADNLAVFADAGFGAAGRGRFVPFGMAWQATLAFSFQILCDFWGYSAIAKGLALLMGFRFPDNFNYPYLAATFSDFWRRWHMTLSTWLRDYLYTPLGGNRVGAARTYANLLATMLLGGLWHGASWTFVAWGGLHGLGLAVERALFGRRRRPESGLYRALWWAAVQLTVLAGWVLFRSESFGAALRLLASLTSPLWEDTRPSLVGVEPMAVAAVATAAGMHLVAFARERGRARARAQGFAGSAAPALRRVLDDPRLLGAAAGAMLFALAVFPGDPHGFIYFQF